MRIIILFLFVIAIGNDAMSQTPKKKEVSDNRATPPKKSEIQSQMNEVTNGIVKEIAELEKQLKTETDEETIKDLKEQIEMLKKQLKMMQGLNKNLSAMPDKTIQKGLEEEADESAVPKRDVTRISSIPKTILSEALLALFIKNIHLQIEKIISPIEIKGATDMYNETMAKHNSIAAVANTASACWMAGNPEKALYILGKICISDITDADNLNNYAAFLAMSGGEQAAIPILDYLNAKYPNNSTVLNNLGQAWFGLGDIDKSKKYLDAVLEVYKTHSVANNTLATIYESEGKTDEAINALKVSLKESYDPEKEIELSRLGYEVKLMDIPRLTVPFPKDPYNLNALMNAWDPNKIQTSAVDPSPAYGVQDFVEGIKEFKEELIDRSVELEKKLHDRLLKLTTDLDYNKELVGPNNNALNILARRCIYLYNIEQTRLGTSLKRPLHEIDQNISGPFSDYYNELSTDQANEDPNGMDFLSLQNLLTQCKIIWYDEVKKPLAMLAASLAIDQDLSKEVASVNCNEIDQRMEAYFAKRKEIYSQGVKKIQDLYIRNSEKLTDFILHDLYSATDESEPQDLNGLGTLLISHLDRTIEKESKQNVDYQKILTILALSADVEAEYTSACIKTPKPARKTKAIPLKNHQVKIIPCQFIKIVMDDETFFYAYNCNTFWEKKDKRLGTDKSRGNKGSAYKSKSGNKKSGPAQAKRGPQNDLIEYETSPAPLTAEEKDPSQFYMEYDKWGKLMGLSFQLNKDGTAFADNDPDPTPSETRWTWNAIASAKKGFLNKLIIK
jgi:tetratricopeptide (TPR) repeat protein